MTTQLQLINIIIIIIIISFMQGIYTYIPETNHVPRDYSVAAILLLLFMVLISLVPVFNLLYFTLVLSEVCVQCPMWMFSVVPWLYVFLVWCPRYYYYSLSVFLTLEMGLINCLETSVKNYHYSLGNNAEERSSDLPRGRSLMSRIQQWTCLRGICKVFCGTENRSQAECTRRNLFLCVCRWVREVHGSEDLQQAAEDAACYRRLERGLYSLLASRRRWGEASRVGAQRSALSAAEPLRRTGPRLGIPSLQRRRQTARQGELCAPCAGIQEIASKIGRKFSERSACFAHLEAPSILCKVVPEITPSVLPYTWQRLRSAKRFRMKPDI